MTIVAKTDSANLDFLRAYAVLTVYFGHLLQTFHVDHVFGGLTIYDFAQTGVIIFFVHTSLVLMLSLERTHASGLKLFQTFYIRRVFRIYPLSMATVILTALARVPAFPTLGYTSPGTFGLLANLGLIQNVAREASYPAVLWSLPYEVQMYLVLPMLFVALKQFRYPWLPCAVWVVSIVALLMMFDFNVGGLPLLLRYTPCFLGGVIAYRIWSVSRLRVPFFWWPITITLCVLARSLGAGLSVPQAASVTSWLIALVLGLVVPHFAEVRLGSLRTWSGLIARYSYGIYLSHCAVFWIAFVLLKGTSYWIQGATCVIFSILFPIAMYHCIEKPMIELGVMVSTIGWTHCNGISVGSYAGSRLRRGVGRVIQPCVAKSDIDLEKDAHGDLKRY